MLITRSLHPQFGPARHPYRDSPGYFGNESPVLQLAYEVSGMNLVQLRNGVYGLCIDRKKERDAFTNPSISCQGEELQKDE